jgi:hypothetical protein
MKTPVSGLLDGGPDGSSETPSPVNGDRAGLEHDVHRLHAGYPRRPLP